MPEEFEAPNATSEEDSMAQKLQEQITRPEELGPDVKAELKSRIEAFREVRRALFRRPGAGTQGAIEAFTRCWEGIVDALEPVLPLQVTLPDEFRPVAIQMRSQIKNNVVQAVYQAVS
jgi:hypothetical protein